MKSFIFDQIIKKVKKYSENLDVKNILCEKPWIVFNDTGEKEVFIFRTDGTVLVTNNGEGVITTWEWIPTNQSLMIKRIEQEKSIVILRPAFVNNTILALQLDGTEKYTFLIDENNKEKFAPKTLTELKQYFIEIEMKAIEAERQRLLQEAEEEEKRRLEEERRKAQEIEDNKVAEKNKKIKIELDKKAYDIVHTKQIKSHILIFLSISIIVAAIIIYIIFNIETNLKSILSIIVLLLTKVSNDYFIKYIRKRAAQEYIDAHPGEQVNNHLKQYI